MLLIVTVTYLLTFWFDVVPTAGDDPAHFAHSAMPIRVEAECKYRKLNGTMTGQQFRDWRGHIMDEAAGYTDASGSSLADYLVDTDMGPRCTPLSTWREHRGGPGDCSNATSTCHTSKGCICPHHCKG